METVGQDRAGINTDEGLIRRLVRRYKLWGLQRMVVSNWPTSPAIPEVARLGDIDYPPELMQFPRSVPTDMTRVGPTNHPSDEDGGWE